VDIEERIRQDFERARGGLNERTLRLYLAEKASAVGYGGVTLVHRATGVARCTIKRGLEEAGEERRNPAAAPPAGRIRREGGGRAPLTVHYPRLNESIEAVLEPAGFGGPGEPPLRWTLDSARRISARLKESGLGVSPSTARKQLRAMGYAFQTTSRHMLGVNQHPDGNAQFSRICGRVALEAAQGNPVLSLESRRLASGEAPSFARFRAREYPPSPRPGGITRGLHGMRRVTRGAVIETDRADSEFAAHSVYGWWKTAGRRLFPDARLLYLVVGRGGCSFASRDVWVGSVSELADKIRLPVAVSHFQPGTSRWEPGLARRLFSFWSTGWRDDLPADYENSVSLVCRVDCPPSAVPACRLDHRGHGRERDRGLSAGARLVPDPFRGEWNYTVLPARRLRRPRPKAPAAGG
jgi:hypothetical protein